MALSMKTIKNFGVMNRITGEVFTFKDLTFFKKTTSTIVVGTSKRKLFYSLKTFKIMKIKGGE